MFICITISILSSSCITNKDVVYLIDPPYLSTDVSSYNKATFWGLKDYLDVIRTLEQGRYFYFSSNKSQIIELFEWVQDYTGSASPFTGAKITTRVNHVSNSAKAKGKYTDIMVYKGWESNITY